MSTSPTSICNIALGWLGQSTITSLEDANQTAQLCKQNYAPLRDAVIEARYWRFASLRTTSQSNDVPGSKEDLGFPQWGGGFVHTIPNEYAQVFRCYTDVTGVKESWIQANWERIDNYIISYEPFIFMEGVRIVEDTNKFSALFVQALAARLAADLAIPITQNRSLQADMWSLYNDKLSEATVRDGQQGRSEDLTATRLTRARRA